jgi:hypothetical protein
MQWSIGKDAGMITEVGGRSLIKNIQNKEPQDKRLY